MVKWLTNFICEVYLLCKWVYTYHENYCGNDGSDFVLEILVAFDININD